MAKHLLIQVDWRRWLKIPIKYAAVLEDFEFVKSDNMEVYEPDTEHNAKIEIVDERVFSQEIIDNHYKQEMERYQKNYWDERKEKKKLEEKLEAVQGAVQEEETTQ